MFNGQVPLDVLGQVLCLAATLADGKKPESKQVAAASNGLNGTRPWVEKRVLVDGKWLREGKRSDNQLPTSGPPSNS